ncbi:hypothetical protein C8R47DRAFT_1210861 [Mycena vitilis]|nr:hypothetical protein C8R47DRAFT_1210861 [Mycena vitilis]
MSGGESSRADASESDPRLSRDEEFFKDSGDCYIRVDAHLFKIHSYHLLRGDVSVFADMFMLPSGPHPSQGSTESDPIVLVDDSVERFRAFLKLAYAEPLDFQVVEMKRDQLPTLIHCAHFAHKYNIAPILTAVLEGIVHSADARFAIDWKIYVSLLELSKLCGAIESEDSHSYEYHIRVVVEWGWVGHLADRTYRELADALEAGESYGLNSLVAFASFHYLVKMTRDAPVLEGPPVLSPPFRDHPWLKPHQRLRILSGAWSQERAWTNFAGTVPKFQMPDHSCWPPTSCLQLWDTEWRRAATSPKVLSVSSGDLIRRKFEFQQELKPLFATSKCISGAFNLKRILAALETGSCHFVEPVLD